MLHRLITIGLDGKRSLYYEDQDIARVLEVEELLDSALFWRSEIHSIEGAMRVIWSGRNSSGA